MSVDSPASRDDAASSRRLPHTMSNAGIDTGVRVAILRAMPGTRKITVEISEDLLERARKSSGEGITGTVRRGLELVAAGRAYDELKKLRGKVRLGIDLEALREDR